MLVQQVAKPMVEQVVVCCDPGLMSPVWWAPHSPNKTVRLSNPFISVPYGLPEGSGDTLIVTIGAGAISWLETFFDENTMPDGGIYNLTADPIILPSPQKIKVGVMYNLMGASPAFSFVVVGFTVVPIGLGSSAGPS